MVRILLTLLLTLPVYAANGNDTFEKQCVSCHQTIPVSFEKFYMQYLLFTSSQETAKEAIFYYLKDPKRETSVMPEHILDKWGVMPKPDMDEATLKEMVEIFVKRYDLRSKLH